jgi:hypothetical protein
MLATEITFYLIGEGGRLPDCGHAYQLAVSEFRSHVRWYRTEQMRHERPIDVEAASMLPFWCASEDARRREYALHFGSGVTPEEVGPWGFEVCFLDFGAQQLHGYFHLTVPFEQGEQEPQRVATLVAALADALPFRSGHAGFGIQLDEGEDFEERDKWARAWCRRNIGISARDLMGSLGAVTDGIRNVSWITLVGEPLLSRLGEDVERLENRFGDDIAVQRCGSGLLIRAGDAPRLGDVNRGEDMELYRRVNAVLKPIRIEEHPPFPGFSEEDTSEWLERLDQP